MCSFCTRRQNWHIKKALYKSLLMFIELFELGKESYNVNIIVYYICKLHYLYTINMYYIS